MSIYDAAMKYKTEGTPLVVIGGKEYGTGSSRDWAAKGTILQGVRAVITESFERIHRSNLIGMGVMPLQFQNGETRKTFSLDGTETITLKPCGALAPKMEFDLTVTKADGSTQSTKVVSRIDTEDELNYFKNGGILQYTIRKLK